MDQFDQFDQASQSGKPQPISSQLLLLRPSPPLPTNTSEMLALPPEAIYPSRELLYKAIQNWAKPRGYAFTGGSSKKTSSGRIKAYYLCDRCPPIPPAREDRIRDTQTRGTSCPFSVIALQITSIEWELKHRPGVQYSTHNHKPSQNPSAHYPHRQLSITAQNTVQSFYSAGIQPQQTLTYLRQVDPTTLALPQDLYNQNAAIRRANRQGQSTTEALIQHLQNNGIKHSILKDPITRRLKGLFIACPESITYLQSHHDVLLIDNTYSTNRFNLPLMDIIG